MRNKGFVGLAPDCKWYVASKVNTNNFDFSIKSFFVLGLTTMFKIMSQFKASSYEL